MGPPPAVRFTTLLFDLLALLGLAAVGLRFGGTRLAAVLAFAWAANPFTQYVSSSNANDAIMPAFLIWGFWAASSDVGRGSLAALAAWAKRRWSSSRSGRPIRTCASGGGRPPFPPRSQ